jgi:hypothetical protein
MGPFQPPRARFGALRHPCLILGAAVGVCLSAVAVAWLLVANRVPSLGAFTLERNLIAGAFLGLLMFLPVVRFLRSPGRIFFSGIIAWLILALTYQVMEIRFERLNSRLGAFHLFMLGAVVFGLFAVLDWVACLFLGMRQHPVAVTRR